MESPELWLRVADMGIGALVALFVLFIGARFLAAEQKHSVVREIAWRSEIVEHNSKVASILDNHLTDVAGNQAATAEILRHIDERQEVVSMKALEYMATTSQALATLQKTMDEHNRDERAGRREKRRA